MSGVSRGFFVERLSLVGADRLPAQLTFVDGSNFIARGEERNPSLCELLEYSLGGSRSRAIQSCKTIERVVLRIRDRETDRQFEIERGLTGACRLRTPSDKASTRRERLMNVRPDALEDDSLSLFLLRLAGHEPFALRKNRLGETRTLGFGEIAFLSIVNDARLAGKTAIHLSEQYSRNTFDHAVLQLVSSGRLDATANGPSLRSEPPRHRLRRIVLAHDDNERGFLGLSSCEARLAEGMWGRPFASRRGGVSPA